MHGLLNVKFITVFTKATRWSHPQTVGSSPHFDSRLPKTDFDFVFQPICSQFSQVSHAFRVFIHDKIEMINWKNLVLVDCV